MPNFELFSCTGIILYVKCRFLKKEKRRKNRKKIPENIQKEYLYVCVCLISNKSHQMENGNMLWPTALVIFKLFWEFELEQETWDNLIAGNIEWNEKW